jgi:hypothetical protein
VELTVAAEATHATQQLSAGLVVGLQELLAALKMQQGGSGAVQAMVAMQNTVAAAIAVRRGAPGRLHWAASRPRSLRKPDAVRPAGTGSGREQPQGRGLGVLSAAR